MILRDRCKGLYQKLGRDGMLRQGDPVQSIFEFVQSEIGRNAAGDALEDTKSLILYFATEKDRDDFVALIRGMKPGMVAKTIP